MRRNQRGADRIFRRRADLQILRQREPDKAAFNAVVPVRGRQTGASRTRRHLMLRRLAIPCGLRRSRQLLRKTYALTRAGGRLAKTDPWFVF